MIYKEEKDPEQGRAVLDQMQKVADRNRVLKKTMGLDWYRAARNLL